MTGGDLNPGYFINPPALTYLLAAYLSVDPPRRRRAVVRRRPGRGVPGGARGRRWSSASATVAATYAAGREWFDRRAGLVAAAIMAVAFLPVFYSRLALNDGPGMLPCALALWASAIVLRTGSTQGAARGRRRASGVAASLKYSDGAIVIALVAAAFLSPELTLQAGAQGPRARRADLDRGRDRHQPVPVRGLGHVHARPRPPAQVRVRRRRCSASPSATAGGTT